MFNKNCCDGIYNSFDIHFTSVCDNKCKHCVDTHYCGTGIAKPDPVAIAQTIINNQNGYDDVLAIQWIFRSRIRKDEPINLYIPSVAVRSLFISWLNGDLK